LANPSPFFGKFAKKAPFFRNVARNSPVSMGVTKGDEWESCASLGKYGTVCGIVTADRSTLTLKGKVTWDGHKVFEYTFEGNKVCASEAELIELVATVACLEEFKPLIDKIVKIVGHLPAKVFSVCLVVNNISWKGTTVRGCAHLDITLMCWMKKCAFKGNKNLGCFVI